MTNVSCPHLTTNHLGVRLRVYWDNTACYLCPACYTAMVMDHNPAPVPAFDRLSDPRERGYLHDD